MAQNEWSMSLSQRFWGLKVIVHKIMDSRFAVNPLIDEKMHFAMTSSAKYTKIFNRTIVPVFVYMMNVKIPFFRLFSAANFAFFRQIISGKRNITPSFIFRAIQMMSFTFKRILTFFRTKTGFIFSVKPGLIGLSAIFANFCSSRFCDTNRKTFSRTKFSSLDGLSTRGAKFFHIIFSYLYFNNINKRAIV